MQIKKVNKLNFCGYNEIAQNLKLAIRYSFDMEKNRGDQKIIAGALQTLSLKTAVKDEEFREFLNGGYLKFADELKTTFDSGSTELSEKAFENYKLALIENVKKFANLREYYTKTNGKLAFLLHEIAPDFVSVQKRSGHINKII